jgi:hypothetical protein
MTTTSVSIPGVASSDQLVLRAAVSAYLGRYRGDSRYHTESDLRIFLAWCTEQDLQPLSAVRADIERYVRWLQDVRRFQPSTVSRRLSVVVGFYRVCVIDAILTHSPADYVRRPVVPPESPTLGLGHLQSRNRQSPVPKVAWMSVMASSSAAAPERPVLGGRGANLVQVRRTCQSRGAAHCRVGAEHRRGPLGWPGDVVFRAVPPPPGAAAPAGCRTHPRYPACPGHAPSR